jgi:hypothetical protein
VTLLLATLTIASGCASTIVTTTNAYCAAYSPIRLTVPEEQALRERTLLLIDTNNAIYMELCSAP